MLYGENDKKTSQNYSVPIFGSAEENRDIPKYRLGETSVEPRIAYQLLKDQLMDEGNARQNLATFCQTYMEPEARRLMEETLEKKCNRQIGISANS
ncbi:glutamate decarboxylase [Listeria floridensis FSL S10-1187]|uniref:Glutamate decarboxylase n=1 Tax=Listeria floridensis FSL S10-1187 TaxID=1265817 RepID=A0ABP3AZA0_9LIST|nr:glutamate decarboxylase [Listeria floridensis FSL S10-1187]